MREYYTEAFYARVLKSNINDKANAQRIHPPQLSLTCISYVVYLCCKIFNGIQMALF